MGMLPEIKSHRLLDKLDGRQDSIDRSSQRRQRWMQAEERINKSYQLMPQLETNPAIEGGETIIKTLYPG